ncbi:RES family NAD+ phosphorylase [Roseomonas stagni]|uniref:RES family NAD+ phosphorylase n=1 Tax=Falsiroseomonas algicola TaxID=2716930 RepID=A0A6M1LTU4_9PROT|nr:RES family NAD+ phosphorylase [Falsiroseomonas algicola]NGM23870.1 RES family NAD+ phosphorylase [Falsiroseomonas algicola]
MRRGPADPVPLPPDRLGDLPLRRLPAGVPLHRIHRRQHGPLHWSGGPGRPRAGRFDSPSGLFGTLYAAPDFAAAFAETVLRNPRQPLVSLAEIEARAVTVLTVAEAVEVVDLTGPGLSRLGLDARLLTADYALRGAWAEAFFHASDRVAGVLYPSRFDPSLACVALFERASAAIRPGSPAALGDRLAAVASVLDRYGKAVDTG